MKCFKLFILCAVLSLADSVHGGASSLSVAVGGGALKRNSVCALSVAGVTLPKTNR